MTDVAIRCEIVLVEDAAASGRVGETFLLGDEPPEGMSAAAFCALAPLAAAMRKGRPIPGEHADGVIDVPAADYSVVYRLSRVYPRESRADAPIQGESK